MEAMMTETSGESGYPNASKFASSIALIAGLWFFASPWVYEVYQSPGSWNNWIVGSVITILALARLSVADLKRTQWISWINCLLAIWVFVSPWVFQYAGNSDRLANCVSVGVILFVAAIFSVLATPKVNTLTSRA